MSTPSIAANAYRMASSLANQAQPADSAAGAAPDFGAMVKTAVEHVIEQGREADQKSLAMVEGKADVLNVVTAIAETEVAMETLVSVRDRVISAYQEIMRMPI